MAALTVCTTISKLRPVLHITLLLYTAIKNLAATAVGEPGWKHMKAGFNIPLYTLYIYI